MRWEGGAKGGEKERRREGKDGRREVRSVDVEKGRRVEGGDMGTRGERMERRREEVE